MSAAREIAEEAPVHIESLIADMLEGDHQDNVVLLGTVFDGQKEIQIQLMVTQNPRDFLDDHGCNIFVDDEDENTD